MPEKDATTYSWHPGEHPADGQLEQIHQAGTPRSRHKHGIILSESGYYIQVTAIALLLFVSAILFMVYFRKQAMAQQIMEQLRTEKKLRARDERYKTYKDWGGGHLFLHPRPSFCGQGKNQ
jgi:hypothetical protein